MLTIAEEKYIKAIYKIVERENTAAGTNSIASELNTSAASVTDMIKKLSDKNLINYQKYKGVSLSQEGLNIATQLIRKHRLWKTFLVNTLNFSWEKIQDIANQMEHIKSDELVNKLEIFLDKPKFDPHGDPIPNADGRYTLRAQIPLSRLRKGDKGKVVAVRDHSEKLLSYLNQINIGLGTTLEILDKFEYDKSLTVKVGMNFQTISDQVASQILMKRTS